MYPLGTAIPPGCPTAACPHAAGHHLELEVVPGEHNEVQRVHVELAVLVVLKDIFVYQNLMSYYDTVLFTYKVGA